MHLYVQEYLIFYIHTNGIQKKEYTSMSKQLKMYTYYSTNQQYVKGVKKKMRKGLLDKWNNHMTTVPRQAPR